MYAFKIVLLSFFPGAGYSVYCTFSYLSVHYGDIISPQFYKFFLPWLLYYFYTNHITAATLALVFFGYFSTGTCIGGTFYFFTQSYLVLQGQTQHEWSAGIKRYKYPVLEHIRTIFGPLWLLNFIVPCPFLRSKHNGLDWKIHHGDGKEM